MPSPGIQLAFRPSRHDPGVWFVLLFCVTALLSAAEPDAWQDALRPAGEGWRSTAQDLVFNNESEPKTLDPHLITGVVEARLALALFEGLTSLDPRTLEPRPGMASSWEADADGLSIHAPVPTTPSCLIPSLAQKPSALARPRSTPWA